MDIDIRGGKPHPIKVGTVTTVDMDTGEVIGVQKNAMTMLPTKPGTCIECGVDHKNDEPHNQQSLTYQIRFYATHGRYPTWSDAMAHCSDETKAIYRIALHRLMHRLGMEIPEDLIDPEPTGR